MEFDGIMFDLTSVRSRLSYLKRRNEIAGETSQLKREYSSRENWNIQEENLFDDIDSLIWNWKNETVTVNSEEVLSRLHTFVREKLSQTGQIDEQEIKIDELEEWLLDGKRALVQLLVGNKQLRGEFNAKKDITDGRKARREATRILNIVAKGQELTSEQIAKLIADNKLTSEQIAKLIANNQLTAQQIAEIIKQLSPLVSFSTSMTHL